MSRTSSPSAGPSAMSGVKSLKRTPGLGKSGMSRSLLATRSLIWLTPSPEVVERAVSGWSAPRLRSALGLVARSRLGVLVHRSRRAVGLRPARGTCCRARGVGTDDGRLERTLGCGDVRLDTVPRHVLLELPDRRLVAAQVDEQRRRDEDRGI